MASLKDMRVRIAATKATQKITKAMQMVAASKLRRAQEAMFGARPYARKMMEVLNSLATRAQPERELALEHVHQVVARVSVPLDHDARVVAAEDDHAVRSSIAHLLTETGYRILQARDGGLGGEVSLRAPVLPDLKVLVRGFPILFRGAVVRAPVYQVLASLDGVLGGDVWNSGIVRIDMTNGVFAVRRPRPN